MIKLGTIVKDNITGLRGMLTHLQTEMNGARWYSFQPKGLSPETGKPVDSLWITEERIIGGVQVPDVYLALDVLGTDVEDEASGFKGKAISTVLHISGCVHVTVQPATIIKTTGAVAGIWDFDIRRLKGKAIKKMSENERKRDEQERPSPMTVSRHTP